MSNPSVQSKVDAVTIFCDALDHSSPEGRARYLEEACNGDAPLQAHIEALLRAHEDAGPFLKESAAETDRIDSSPTDNVRVCESPGMTIGPYELKKQIGEGGFGVVYMAQQRTPVHRKVALKIIKPGMDSREVIARFESERQALALMDHQNIAKVLDGGATDSGRPYFVMELVEGVPITEFCDKNHLTGPRRLTLFTTVCRAVQHAHQKGVIHRDIKPANILVSLDGDEPVVKVIDFGVAKAIGRRLTDKTLLTAYGQLIGTPLYMSPEQVEMDGLRVDTRSDVYSLGVVLYELLTGSTPVDGDRLKKVPFSELQRIIREEDPPPPSTRASTLDESVSVASAVSKTEHQKIGRFLRGDLDLIVMKALEKERGRRYQTPSALACDIERFLRNEAIEARAPSTAYRLRRFSQRNKAAVATVAMVTVALLLGTAASTWQAIRATAASKQARTEAAITQAAIDFINRDLLAQADPANQRNRDLKLRTVLDRAAKTIEGEFSAEPLVKASIHQTIGDTYLALGLCESAEPHLVSALRIKHEEIGDEHAGTLKSMNSLAGMHQANGQFAAAESLFSDALAICRRVLGKEHPVTLTTTNNLALLYRAQGNYAKAEPLLTQTLEIRRRMRGVEHRVTLTTMNNLALVYLDQGDFAKAEPLFTRAKNVRRRVLGEEHPHTLTSMHNLALLYQSRGDYAKAKPLHVRTLRVRRRVLGDEHPSTLISMNCVAAIYQAEGNYAKAAPLFVQTLKVRRRLLGDEHPDTLTSMQNLAALYQARGEPALAEPLYIQALETRRRCLGKDHPDTLTSANGMAAFYQARGETTKAEPLLVDTLAVRRRKLGDDHPNTLTSMHNLAALYQAQGKSAQAEPLYIQALEMRRRVLGDEHPHTLISMNNLAMLYQARSEYAKAEPLLERALKIHRRVMGEEHRHTIQLLNNLSLLYQEQGELEKAAALYTQTLEACRQVLGDEHPDTLALMHNLALLYEDLEVNH